MPLSGRQSGWRADCGEPGLDVDYPRVMNQKSNPQPNVILSPPEADEESVVAGAVRRMLHFVQHDKDKALNLLANL